MSHCRGTPAAVLHSIVGVVRMADAREQHCHVAAQLQHLQMCKVICVLQLFSLGESMVKNLSAAPTPTQLGCSTAESGETNVRWSDKGAWQKRRL